MDYKEKECYAIESSICKTNEPEENVSEVRYDTIEHIYEDSQKICESGETSLQLCNYIEEQIADFDTKDGSEANVFKLFQYIKISENLIGKCSLFQIARIMRSVFVKCFSKNFIGDDRHELKCCLFKSIMKLFELFPSACSYFKDSAIGELEKIKNEEYLNSHSIKFVAIVFNNCNISSDYISEFLTLLMQYNTLLINVYNIKLVLKLTLLSKIDYEKIDDMISSIVVICNDHPISQIIPSVIEDILELIRIYIRQSPDLKAFKKRKILKTVSKFMMDRYMDHIFSILELLAKQKNGIETKLCRIIEQIYQKSDIDKLTLAKNNVIKIILQGQDAFSIDIFNDLIECMDIFPLHTILNLAEKLISIVENLEELCAPLIDVIDEVLSVLEYDRDDCDEDTSRLIYGIGDCLDSKLKEKLKLPD